MPNFSSWRSRGGSIKRKEEVKLGGKKKLIFVLIQGFSRREGRGPCNNEKNGEKMGLV